MSGLTLPPPRMSWKMVYDVLGDEARERLVSSLATELRLIVEDDWRFTGRREQLPPPPPWHIWFYKAGRGSGKTRSGAEWVISQVRHGYRHIGIIAPTASDLRDVIVEGESGILTVSSDRDRPVYESTKRRVTWPNGAIASLFSAEEPDRLRGPQFDKVWCDEIAAWKYVQQTWDTLMFCLRLGDNPQIYISSTPKPTRLLKELVRRANAQEGVVLTEGSSYDNLPNLAPTYKSEVLSKYEGTTLGKQEIEGRILEEVAEALWSRELIEGCRYDAKFTETRDSIHFLKPRFTRIVIAVDPPISSDSKAAEAGIIVTGLTAQRDVYVLGDFSMIAKPEAWAAKVVWAYRYFGADRIVAEKNQGGEMVSSTIRAVDNDLPVKLVHASKGKVTRAEPVSALYEQGRVKHIRAFGPLEDEMCTWVAGESDESPNRLDALVYAITELVFAGKKRAGALHRRAA